MIYSNGIEWYSRNAVKRVNAIQFNKDASKIVIADKFGDVFW